MLVDAAAAILRSKRYQATDYRRMSQSSQSYPRPLSQRVFDAFEVMVRSVAASAASISSTVRPVAMVEAVPSS